MNYWLTYFLSISLTFSVIWKTEVKGISINSKRKLDFTVSSWKNQTGHWETRLSVKKAAAKLPNAWKVDVMHSTDEQDGLLSFHLLGILTAPPPLPADYELFQGIGYYKLHESADSFDEASLVCTKEGGHLAIINSEAESGALQTMFKRIPQAPPWAYVGIHDRLKEGEFVTIFGEPLSSTGFKRWDAPSEPNGGTRENCGLMHRNGALHDGGCNTKIAFFCEFDLSWNNL